MKKYKIKIKDKTEGVVTVEAETKRDAELQGLKLYEKHSGSLATYIQKHGELQAGGLSINAKESK